MSLKSFDKFCESMIMGKTGSQKEIFDERQNQIRTSLNVETLMIFAVLSAVGILLQDMVHWCESSFPVLVIAFGISVLWWTIRAMIKGCLFGVKGRQTIYTAFLIIAECSLYMLIVFENEPNSVFVFENGISDGFACLIAFGLGIISGIIIVCGFFRNKRISSKNGE